MTGDLTPGTDLAVIDPADVEAAADPAQYVVQACERAKTWLAHALEHGGIDEIVELKSQAEAIRIYTMQKQLGKDAELSAAEIVRRAERGIGVAIRKGQDSGEIRRKGERSPRTASITRLRFGKTETVQAEAVDSGSSLKPSPTHFATDHELHGNGAGIYGMTDGVSDDQFEEAIAEAKAEGNLSRANVVRQAQAKTSLASDRESTEWIPTRGDTSPRAAARRRELIRQLASQAWTSHQISDRINTTPDGVRRIARDEGIAIPADDALGRGTRKSIDSNRIVRETVSGLEGLEIALDLVSYDDLDRSEIEHWTTSLTTSIRILNRLNKRLKEIVQ
jgi:hypothetical protein